MREINAQLIAETVKKLCIDANCHLTSDNKNCICDFHQKESWPQAKEILSYRPNISLDDVKLISGKAILKGSANIFCL